MNIGSHVDIIEPKGLPVTGREFLCVEIHPGAVGHIDHIVVILILLYFISIIHNIDVIQWFPITR